MGRGNGGVISNISMSQKICRSLDYFKRGVRSRGLWRHTEVGGWVDYNTTHTNELHLLFGWLERQ